jgi:flagellar biosynthetic protein FlhB
MGEQSGDKTEEPTPHKLQEARKKGQIAKSKELTTAILVLVTYRVFAGFATKMWQQIVEYAQSMFRMVSTIASQLDMAYSQQILLYSITNLLKIIMPILLVTFLVAIIVEVLQTQFVMSTEAMTPKLEKLNPMNGLKRIFSMKGFIQILITLLKIVIVAWIVWSVIKDRIQLVIISLQMTPWNLMFFVGDMVMTMAMKIGGFYLAIALLDYLYQKYEFHKSMMMTKQEVKEEYKRLEGDPTIKQAQRQRQREAAMRRQKGAVPNADVVVTNPVHLACAIRYNAELDKAPLLLAKGKRLIAEDIKRIAEENFVPVVENESLARSIYDTTEPGNAIPPELYRPVAELLAFVYKLGRNKAKRKDRPTINRA